MQSTYEDPFHSDIAWHVWDTRYRYRDADGEHDVTVRETWRRVARTLAAVESDPTRWEQTFYNALEGFRFLPGGRIQAGAGTDRDVTLFNCFVMGVVPDDMQGIFEALGEAALTLQQGGGIGCDFSTLRPAGAEAVGHGTIASGPVSFMGVWDAMCATILSTGARRGAMMATLRCDHPDIREFIEAKRTPGELTRFNLSVQVTDAFMEAVREDREWQLVFPDDQLGPEPAGEGTVQRRWTGRDEPVPCRVVRTVSARHLWHLIMKSTYDHAEPGVLFVDRVARWNNLHWREHITATNPCGEIPLPPYGACDLGSINLAQFVRDAFTERAQLDLDGIMAVTRTGVRMLDNVIDSSRFALPELAEMARGTRRLGLGITGLADALIMLGLHYGTPSARAVAAYVMRTICHTAYRASVELARDKEPFPFFDRDQYLQSRFVQGLPEDIREGIAQHGIRNSHLLAIAPTGTISLLANNVSSGIEPVFSFEHTRQVLDRDGERQSFELHDHAWARWRQAHPDDEPPDYFVTALDLSPEAHLEMQAALQPFVDNAISKTINVPEDADFEQFKQIYDLAWDRGLKGCTTYRPNPVTGAVLEAAPNPHCGPERECD